MQASSLKLHQSYRRGRGFYLYSIKIKGKYSYEPANKYSRCKNKKSPCHLGRDGGISVTSHMSV